MKYESTILKRLIDTYGVVGNPRYISEIIKEFIVRGKERFPELFTYQADWLAHIDEFGLNPTYTVSYTGQSIYAPNTLEKPVKSAILRGQTLVNLFRYSSSTDGFGGYFDKTTSASKYMTFNNRVVKYHLPANTNIPAGASVPFRISANNERFVVGKEYSLVFRVLTLENAKSVEVLGTNYIDSTDYIKVDFIFDGTSVSMIKLSRLPVDSTLDMTIEVEMLYLGEKLPEDMDLNIPYFEGMQSVKMPGLTTSNEDGTKTNILSTSEDVVLRGIGDVQDTLDLISGEVVHNIGEIVLDGSEDWVGENERFRLYKDNVIPNKWTNGISNHFIGNRGQLMSGVDYDNYFAINGYGLCLYVRDINLFPNPKSQLNEFKSWLSERNAQGNPVVLQYCLSQASIKTVDLTILDQNGQNVKHLMSFNGGTHFTTSSQDGSLLPMLTVDVVTDLEEILMVCSSEGNTM